VDNDAETRTVSLSDAEVVARTSDFVRGLLGSEPTGHDWWHAERVRLLAKRIAGQEGADTFVVELAALLHDVADVKFSGSEEAGPRAARTWLTSMSVEPTVVFSVGNIIERMSFNGAGVAEKPISLEGRCVRDADRLDAIGAIGIARTFAYGGHVGRPLYDPELPAETHSTPESYRTNLGSTINHFHEKLLLLRDRLHTDSARKIADRRHEFMMRFLDEFHAEWDVAEEVP
jgi:uncharacterized protein